MTFRVPLLPPIAGQARVEAGAAAAGAAELAKEASHCGCGLRKSVGYWFCKGCWVRLEDALQWALLRCKPGAFESAVRVLWP